MKETKKVYCLNPKIVLKTFRRLPSGRLAPRKIKGAKGICPYCGSTNARLTGQYFDGIDPNDKDGKRRFWKKVRCGTCYQGGDSKLCQECRGTGKVSLYRKHIAQSGRNICGLCGMCQTEYVLTKRPNGEFSVAGGVCCLGKKE